MCGETWWIWLSCVKYLIIECFKVIITVGLVFLETALGTVNFNISIANWHFWVHRAKNCNVDMKNCYIVIWLRFVLIVRPFVCVFALLTDILLYSCIVIIFSMFANKSACLWEKCNFYAALWLGFCCFLNFVLCFRMYYLFFKSVLPACRCFSSSCRSCMLI